MSESTRFYEALELLLWFRAREEIRSLLTLGEELLEAARAEQAHAPARIQEFIIELPLVVDIIE